MKKQTLGLNWSGERRTRKRYGTTCPAIRQKAGEIEGFKSLEVGALKWCKEHWMTPSFGWIA
jgi:hypothetical protein